MCIHIKNIQTKACWFSGFGFMRRPVGRLSAAQWAGFRDNGLTLYFIVSHGVGLATAGKCDFGNGVLCQECSITNSKGPDRRRGIF